MSVLSGFFKTKKWRKTPEGYKLQSEWTSAQTVEMNDGHTLEEKWSEMDGTNKNLQNQMNTLSNTVNNINNTIGTKITAALNGDTLYLNF